MSLENIADCNAMYEVDFRRQIGASRNESRPEQVEMSGQTATLNGASRPWASGHFLLVTVLWILAHMLICQMNSVDDHLCLTCLLNWADDPRLGLACLYNLLLPTDEGNAQ